MKRVALLFVILLLDASLGFIQGQTDTARLELPKEKEKQVLNILKANYGDSAPTKLQFVPADLLQKIKLEPDTAAMANANVGQVAQGKILSEDHGELFLDSKPCTHKVMSFQEPYTKTAIGTAKCGNSEYTKYEVEQQKKKK